MLSGVYQAKKKDGTIYYRSNITFKNKHISLGSYPEEDMANTAYLNALAIINDKESYTIDSNYQDFVLSFEKIITLLNYRDNGLYIKTPIYVRQNYFQYFLSPTLDLKFDLDDLFYYSSHKISVRGNHYFVADYGMQVTILSRYGIKNHGVKERDYTFANGDSTDFRYSNIVVINPYYGVTKVMQNGVYKYCAKIHINGNYILGYYDKDYLAAIAYNKAIDCAKRAGIKKNFPQNYIDEISNQQYADEYLRLNLSKKYMFYLSQIRAKNHHKE